MTSNNPQLEQEFIAHGNFLRRSQANSGYQNSLSGCCYNVSNLILIAACVVALVFAAKFLNDDPLYELGEHLLSLRFYRQLIFIIVILPLVLLIPLFNAGSAFFLSGRTKLELGRPLLSVKMIYQIIMAILVFVGLVFIAPSIKFSSVANQLDYELRHHMKRRYENDFSYQFVDSIQENYECCDELWYRANYFDKLPMSCYQQDGVFSSIHDQNCADVIGTMVSNRCMIIAACLVAILVALSSLIAIDISELLSLSQDHYDVGSREAKLIANAEQSGSVASSNRQINHHDEPTLEEPINRLRQSERERERPLLFDRSQQDRMFSEISPSGEGRNHNNHRNVGENNDDEDWPSAYNSDRAQDKRAPTILTRANYIDSNDRPQSPVFVGGGSSLDLTAEQSTVGRPLTKGVLKKSSSIQRIDDSDCDAEPTIHDYQKRIQRELQTRRSLLNVRFAE